MEQNGDVTCVEVILYPQAREIINPAAFIAKTNQYTLPTFTKNYAAKMKNTLGQLVKDAATDLEAVQNITRYLARNTRYINIMDDLHYSTDLPINFSMYLNPEGRLIKSGLGSSPDRSIEEIEDRVLFADSMFKHSTHGACSSTSILRGAMFRAVGLEEKTIVTIPLVYLYEGDETELQLGNQYRNGKFEGTTAVADHFFNLIKIGHRWIRVDGTVMNKTSISRLNNDLYIKILEQNDSLEDDFTQYWKYDSWKEKRPYQYISIIEQQARHTRAYPSQ